MRTFFLVLFTPLYLAFLLVRGVLWLLFVPLHRGLLAVTRRAGFLRLPLLVLFAPIHVVALLVDRNTSKGRVLTGDILRPTFTLPYAFARGPWQVVSDPGDVRRVQLELEQDEHTASLELTVGPPLGELQRDPMMAGAIGKALAEPGLPNGMRWAGMRITTFIGGAALKCLYVVWKDDAPSEGCVQVTFSGPPELEPLADQFVSSVLPAMPAGADGEADGEDGDEADDETPAVSPT